MLLQEIKVLYSAENFIVKKCPCMLSVDSLSVNNISSFNVQNWSITFKEKWHL